MKPSLDANGGMACANVCDFDGELCQSRTPTKSKFYERSTNTEDNRLASIKEHGPSSKCKTKIDGWALDVRANGIPMAAGLMVQRESSCDGCGFERTLKSLPRKLAAFVTFPELLLLCWRPLRRSYSVRG